MSKFEDTHNFDKKELLYETIIGLNGNKLRRIKSSLFYLLSASSFICGIALVISDKPVGVFFLVTLFPIFLLYPLVRFFFGGKDSVAGVVVTVVASEVLKQKLTKKIDRNNNRKRR
jgi:hypothetical protein